ncbi:CcmD family protein [Lacihabitans lacunae]|uniref:CcmD family protein n=1 Tax=Lacihabitans lacunae TaxID=1028214 RepID=A0ABV7YWZ7_9BACT
MSILINILLMQDVTMADTFRADGKIYVVVAIISVILAGLFAYLFSLDRKISKIEKEIKS